MNLMYYIVFFVVVIVLLNIAWPLLVGLFLFMVINQFLVRWRIKKAARDLQKKEAFYETIEKPQSGLDIIDVEYEEK